MDCISTAHPSWLTEEEIEGVGVPVQILAPEIDPVFTPELKVQIELYRRWDSTIISTLPSSGAWVCYAR